MTSTPVVSVLLPVRDGGAHLAEAIESIAGQSYHELEVIAVDDGSTDASAQMLEDWSARDRRVRVVRQEAAGIVAALELARSMASGEYLARMDADDIAHPDRFARQVALMEGDPELTLSGTGVRVVPRSSMTDGALRYENWLNDLVTHDEIERDLFVECPIAHPTFMMRADAVGSVGGYRTTAPAVPEDYDLVLRLWRAGARFGKVDAPLLDWRDSPGRLQRCDPAYEPSAFLHCKLLHLGPSLLRDREGVVICGAGPTGKTFARAAAGLGLRVMAFLELHPGRIGQTIHGAPVHSMDEASAFPSALIVGAVAQPGARRTIRGSLSADGLTELEDFVMVA